MKEFAIIAALDLDTSASVLEIAAKIMKRNKVHSDVKFIIAPASREIFLEASKKGLKLHRSHKRLHRL